MKKIIYFLPYKGVYCLIRKKNIKMKITGVLSTKNIVFEQKNEVDYTEIKKT